MADIGYYTLPVIPSFRGIEGRIKGDLNRAFGRSGTDAGRALVTSASRTISSDRSIERAVESKAKAADKLATATSKVRAAEATLRQAESQGNIAGRARAVEAVTQARVREAAAIRQVQSATSSLESATRTASQNAVRTAESSGGGGGSGAGMMGLMLLGRGGIPGVSALASSAGGAAGMAAKAGIAGVLTAGAAAAIMAPFVAGFKLFNWGAEVGLPLERTLNTLGGVTGATAGQMQAAGQMARQLGSDTQLAGVTASDAAAAMTELAKGGMSVDEAMRAARGTVQLATAGNIDAAEAAKIQSAALVTFGLDASNAQRVADMLAASANASSADVSDLGLALQAGGAAASGFGVSVDDTLTALTLFSRYGINSSDAGTMLKTSLQAITDQGNPAQGAIQELGLQLYDAQGKFVGVESMMKQVADASTHMTQEQFQAATAVLFGSDAMRASMVAAKGGASAWDDASAAVHRQNAAADMAAANMKGLPGVIEGASNALDGIKLSVYDAGNAIATAMGKQALDGLSGFGNWVTQHQPQIVGFFTWIGTEAVGLLAQFASGIETGADVLAGLVNAFGDTMGAVVKAYAFTQDVLGRDEEANKAYATAETLFGLGDGLESVSDTAGKAEDKLNGLKDRLQTAGDQANNAAKATRDLGGAMAQANEVDTVLHEPTPQQLAAIDAAKYKIEAIPGTKDFKVIPQTADAVTELDALRQQQGQKPIGMKVKPDIPAANKDMQSFIDQWQKAIIAPQVNPVPPSTNPLQNLLPPPGAPGSDNGDMADLGGLTPGAVALSARYAANFGLKTISGYRPKVRKEDEHQTGRAIDIGIPDYSSPAGIARGNAVLTDALSMPQVQHVIWRQHIYTQGGGDHAMEDRGNDTQNHYDHVHILLKRLGGKIPGVGFGDKVPVLAEPDEHMFTRADVAAMGGHAAVYAFRAGLHMQEGGRVPDWDRIAQKESGGRWDLPYGDRDSTGGLQIRQGTWLQFGGTAYAPMPYQATKAEQIAVAEKILAGQGPEAWAGGANFFWKDAPATPATGTPATGLDYVSRAQGGTPSTGTRTAGVDPTTGKSGYYTPDPEAIRSAKDTLADREQAIIEADKNIAIQRQQIAELDADAKESQRMSQQAQLDKAIADRDKAVRERDEAKGKVSEAERGEFKEGDTTTDTGGGKGDGESQFGEVGSIFSAFLKDTFGFGDILPDPKEIGAVKMLGAILGIKFVKKDGSTAGGTTNTGTSASPFAGSSSFADDPLSALTSLIPFGMIPTGQPGVVDPMAPGTTPPPMPPPGVHQGTGAPGPVNVDQSRNVTVNGYSQTEVVNGVRREMQWPDRSQTYTPPGG